MKPNTQRVCGRQQCHMCKGADNQQLLLAHHASWHTVCCCVLLVWWWCPLTSKGMLPHSSSCTMQPTCQMSTFSS